jgi:hypothetical protein
MVESVLIFPLKPTSNSMLLSEQLTSKNKAKPAKLPKERSPSEKTEMIDENSIIRLVFLSVLSEIKRYICVIATEMNEHDI